MEDKQNTFNQTNGYAMQYGIILGLWSLCGLACYVLSFRLPILSVLCDLLLVCSPVLAGYLTICFRRKVMIPELGFTFGRGFGFTFLMGVYATLWIALGTYVYLAYFDNGYIFNQIENMMSRPEFVNQMRQSGTWDLMMNEYGSVQKFVNTMRSFGASAYAGFFIYITIFTSPVVSAIVGLIAKKSPNWIIPQK